MKKGPEMRMKMGFQVGDQVIHLSHGLGKIVQIEEKIIHDRKTPCYVVCTRELTVWVPFDDPGRCTLRAPTTENEFEALFKVLNSPNEPLPDDRWERKTYLLEQLNDGQLISICRLVRDLSGYGRKKKLNDVDKAILDRAQNFLLAEWVFALSVPLSQARKKMGELLQI
jgi:RNA polymerase-interacting CarD/CdnL/TRCF family regulator